MTKEILEFLWKKKKWWLIPPAIILILFGLIILFATASPVGPFIYALF